MGTGRGGWIAALLVLLCVVGFGAAPAAAQTPAPPTVVSGDGARLGFDHDGVGVVRWEQRLDAAAWEVVTPTRVTPSGLLWRVPFPAMTPGPHVIAMRACYSAAIGCRESDPFAITVVIAAAPSRLRIEFEPAAPAPGGDQ